MYAANGFYSGGDTETIEHPPQTRTPCKCVVTFLADNATDTIKDDSSLEKIAEKRRNAYGSLNGKVWMADDFDAPLDDFKEYM
jgi:hypothetical protein